MTLFCKKALKLLICTPFPYDSQIFYQMPPVCKTNKIHGLQRRANAYFVWFWFIFKMYIWNILLLNIPQCMDVCMYFAMSASWLDPAQDTFMMQTRSSNTKLKFPKDKKRTIGIPLRSVSRPTWGELGSTIVWQNYRY